MRHSDKREKEDGWRCTNHGGVSEVPPSSAPLGVGSKLPLPRYADVHTFR